MAYGYWKIKCPDNPELTHTIRASERQARLYWFGFTHDHPRIRCALLKERSAYEIVKSRGI